MTTPGDYSMFNSADAAAMTLGYRAALAGKTATANPFTEGDNEFDAWLLGFRDHLPVNLKNGGVVLDRRRLPSARGCMEAEIVLCHLPHNSHTPYATWQRNLDDGGCYWGHYKSDEAEARRDFASRCADKCAA